MKRHAQLTWDYPRTSPLWYQRGLLGKWGCGPAFRLFLYFIESTIPGKNAFVPSKND
jgi:hypothetical protein